VTRRARTRVLAPLLALVAVLAPACSLRADTTPRDIPLADRFLTGGPATGEEAAGTSRIYLLAPLGQDGQQRLRAVSRDVPDDPDALLRSLFLGPNEDEVDAQLSTRLPQGLEITSVTSTGRILNVDVTPGFGDVDANAVRLAVAQIVVTASEVNGVQAVRLRVDGENQAWPVGDGELTTRPLTVYDYPGLIESTQPAYPSIPSPQA
jgi:hypothetical protein